MRSRKPRLPFVIASGNAGKVLEFGALLDELDLETLPQPDDLNVEETGSTFAANARLKAEAVARATGCWTLADDSGLSVEALGGAPGVHSARYADFDSARINRLLRELEAAEIEARLRGGAPNREAHFTAALAVANPSGAVLLEVEGHCPGVILDRPRGAGGFGYDPVFFVPEAGLTFAEMPHSQKAELGHRGRAFAALKPQLRSLLAQERQ